MWVFVFFKYFLYFIFVVVVIVFKFVLLQLFWSLAKKKKIGLIGLMHERNTILFETETQKGSNERLFIWHGHIACTFSSNPLYQATKRHLNNRKTVKNDEKWKKKTYLVLAEFEIGQIFNKRMLRSLQGKGITPYIDKFFKSGQE